MYIINRIEKKNILFFSLKGIITEDQGARAVQELNSIVRKLEKGYSLVFDARRFKPASYDNAVTLTKSALKLMSIRRPDLIIRIGQRDTLKMIDKAFLELNLPVSFSLEDVAEYDELFESINDSNDDRALIYGWIKSNLEVLKAGKPFHISSGENEADILSVAMSGMPLTNEPVTFTANAVSHKGNRLFYRFAYSRDTAGISESESQWMLMTEYEEITTGKCDFTFQRPGKYIVSVKASSSRSDWSLPEIPEARLTVFVKPEDKLSCVENSFECFNDFPFSAGTRIEVVFNRESLSPMIRESVIYECDLAAQSMVIGFVSPESEYGMRYDTMDITVQCHSNDGRISRRGVSAISSRKISDYPVSEDLKQDAMLVRFTMPLESVGLRCDRQFYRCDCACFSKMIEADIKMHTHLFMSGHDFSISDLSLAGAGFKFFDDAPYYKIIKNITDIADRGHITFRFYESPCSQEPQTVSSAFSVMRKNINVKEACCNIGIKFDDIGVSESAVLNYFITVLQLEEKKTV